MGTLKPVPPLDLASMIEEGYDPEAYVLPVHSSIAAMKTITEMRQKNRDKFENLDKDILAFAAAKGNYQSQSTFDIKQKAYKKIWDVLPKREGATLHFCGSTMNKCGTESCDIDLCWAVPAKTVVKSCNDIQYPMDEQGSFDPETLLRDAHLRLQELPEVRNIMYVPARVKIVKFEMMLDGLRLPCDININNTAGVYNTFMLAHYAKIDERFSILSRVLKEWGKKALIIDSSNGYLNSYTMVLMVLHYLQCGVSPPILPNLLALRHDLFGGKLDLHKLSENYDLDLKIKMKEMNDTPIGDLLIGFLRYYAMFNYDNEGIMLRMGCVAPKPSVQNIFFLEEVYDRFTVPKNLNYESMDYIKCTFLDTFLKIMRDPNFGNLMKDERLFMPKFQ